MCYQSPATVGLLCYIVIPLLCLFVHICCKLLIWSCNFSAIMGFPISRFGTIIIVGRGLLKHKFFFWLGGWNIGSDKLFKIDWLVLFIKNSSRKLVLLVKIGDASIINNFGWCSNLPIVFKSSIPFVKFGNVEWVCGIPIFMRLLKYLD